MLADYDAAAIADMMGLGMGPHSEVLSPSGSKVALRRLRRRRTADEGSSAPGRTPAVAPADIEQAVELGLPRALLRHLAERITGADTTRVAALEWMIVPKTTLDRRRDRLSPQESERTERVARIFVQARRALGSEDEAREFMSIPHPELNGRTPLQAARTDLATRQMEQILRALEYGLVL